jgi:DMSO/TMAO reductase YedYZ molybdopterin-dependent catalytic subunit
MLTHTAGLQMRTKSGTLAIGLVLSVLSAFFLVVCTDFSNAQVTPAYADGHLTVKGLVEHPLNLNLTEITVMPSTSEYAVIYCVDFPNIPVTQGNWIGVKLSYLLNLAGADNTAKVAFYASDGYSTDLSMQQAMQDDVILAYQLDGAQLTETLRLVVPGHWGYKWISQVTTIELVGYNYLGRWESSGYSDEASITSNSGIPTKPGSPYWNFPQSPTSPAVSPPP